MTKWLLFGLVVMAVGIQWVPVHRAAPPAPAALRADEQVLAILRRSCFDCHSSETRWPWYSYVAPVSWSVARHVHDGRRSLNFSAWENLPADKQAHAAEEIVEEVAEGEMPLPAYLLAHRDAKVSAADLEVLRRWAAAVQRAAGAGEHGDDD